MMVTRSIELVVCVKNDSHGVSLELRKLYVALANTEAAKHRQLRVNDRSGEDYLYPNEFFLPVELPPTFAVVCCGRIIAMEVTYA